MINMNNFNIISNITEEEYRNLPHISYSTISKFISHGPKSLKETTKQVKSSLSLGSLFDTLLTDSEHFTDKYFIGNTTLTETHLNLIKKYSEIYIEDKSTETLSTFLADENYYPNYKVETRLKYFFHSEDVIKYLEALSFNKNLIYCTQQQLSLIKYKVELLKTHPFTKSYFNNDSCELVFQAKIISDDLMAKCMFDLLIIDHAHSIIVPIDFKFMEDSARNFMRSYERFNYYIQDTLYSEILNYELIAHDLNYEVLDFTFIVLSSVDDIILQYVPEIDFDALNDLVFVNNKIKKGWKTYFDLIKWHLANQVFDYTKDEYENNGIVNIPSTNITNFFSNTFNYGGTENTLPSLNDDLPF